MAVGSSAGFLGKVSRDAGNRRCRHVSVLVVNIPHMRYTYAHVDVKKCIECAMMVLLLIMIYCIHQFYIKIKMSGAGCLH